MPNNVVDALHRIAAASTSRGHIFHRNTITDDDGAEDENMTEEEPIPVMSSDNNQMKINIEQERISPDIEEMGNENND